MAKRKAESDDKELTEESVRAASEQLFSDGKGVRRYSHSGLRYMKLAGDAVLVEQNPQKETQWAKMARKGHMVAWAIRGDEYLARVIDGEVEMLVRQGDE